MGAVRMESPNSFNFKQFLAKKSALLLSSLKKSSRLNQEINKSSKNSSKQIYQWILCEDNRS